MSRFGGSVHSLFLAIRKDGERMAKRKVKIRHAEIVQQFAVRLRELRQARNMTMAELARSASIALSHLGRMESGDASPGLDTLDRLARTLGITVTELLPQVESSDSLSAHQERAKQLFKAFLEKADRETLKLLNPLLARLT